MSLSEEIDAIRTDEAQSYGEKLARLQKIVTKAEAVMLIGRDTSCDIKLRDPLGGHPCCGKTLYLVIEKVYFDEIMAGTKREEYRELSPSNMSRYTYAGEDGRRYLKPFDRIRLCVGYHKNRDEAVIECTGIECDGDMVTFKLGRILEHRPKE